MTTKTHISYLIFNEDITSPLLRRQVIELLEEIRKNTENIEITLLAFISPLSIIKRFSKFRTMKIEMLKKNINLKIILLPVPWPFPHCTFKKLDVGYRANGCWSRWAVRLLPVFVWPIIIYYRFTLGSQIFHCRSYPTAYAAIKLKQFKLFSIKVIFDPRSDFPEENITSGNWNKNDSNYNFWKSAEVMLLNQSDAVACIAKCNAIQYKAVAPGAKLFFAPNNVDCKLFARDLDARTNIRESLGVSHDELLFVYLGAITSTGWHRPDLYRTLIESLLLVKIKFRFVFLVPRHSNALIEHEFNLHIEQGKVILINPNYDEVGRYLSACDYGVMLLHDEKNVVGTKIGEYLASGLPIIVNRHCVGAADLISEESVGLMVDLNTELIAQSRTNGLENIVNGQKLCDWSERVTHFAENYFDNKVVADRYIHQYKHI